MYYYLLFPEENEFNGLAIALISLYNLLISKNNTGVVLSAICITLK
jgi:hypothetical protein